MSDIRLSVYNRYQSNQDGNTALCLAVSNGLIIIVDYLIQEKNADLNTANNVSGSKSE